MIESVAELVGIPYVERGRTVDGCDCLGLVALAYEAWGLAFPWPPEYDAGTLPRASEAAWAAHWEPCGPEVGAMVDMLRAGRRHAGVMVARGQVLHTRRATGSVIQSLAALRLLVRGFWRLREEGASS